MGTWLYQMTTGEVDGEPWSPEDYRLQVWEGKAVAWNARKIVFGDQVTIQPGDTIILFFTKSQTKDCGIYGWGIIQKYALKTNQVTFVPTFPSDYLKMAPAWDDEIESLVNQVRNHFPQGGTMFDVNLEELKLLRMAIKRHFGPIGHADR